MTHVKKVRRLFKLGVQGTCKIEKRALELIEADYGYLPERFQVKPDGREFELNSYERGYLSERLPSRVISEDGSATFLDTRPAEEQARDEVMTLKQGMKMLLGPITAGVSAPPGELREELIRSGRVERLSRWDLYAELLDSVEKIEMDGVTKYSGVMRFARAYRNLDLSISIDELAQKGAKAEENLGAGPRTKKSRAVRRRAFIREQARLLGKETPVWRGKPPQTIAKELLNHRQLNDMLIQKELLPRGRQIDVRTVAGYLSGARENAARAE